MGGENFNNLRKVKRYGKYINNAINYDILQNFRYADAFFYTKMAKRIENDQSDFISTILYYGDDRITEQEFWDEMERFRSDPRMKKAQFS